MRGIFAVVGIEHVEPHVALDQFRHQAVQGAPASGHQLKDLEAFVILAQGAFERFDLSSNSANTKQEFLSVFGSVCHPYTIGQYSS